MKKKITILLSAIVLIVLLILVLDLRVEFGSTPAKITEGIKTISVGESYYLGSNIQNKASHIPMKYTEVSLGDESIRINRSDYTTDEEFTAAVDEAKTKLKEKNKQNQRVEPTVKTSGDPVNVQGTDTAHP